MSPRTGPPPTPRAPRRDAPRNDARVLDAARAVFAEEGPQASRESVAARAGLGVGTIHRRFSGEDALLDAIARLIAEELDQAAASALAHPDPATGLTTFLDTVGTFQTEKRRYAGSLINRVADDDAVSVRTADRVARLTRNAVEAGYLAPDVTGDDIKALLVALRGVIAASPEGDDASWRRFLHVHLTGLRAGRCVMPVAAPDAEEPVLPARRPTTAGPGAAASVTPVSGRHRITAWPRGHAPPLGRGTPPPEHVGPPAHDGDPVAEPGVRRSSPGRRRR